jgi:sulfoxide reductase heme-binding subunit YedZ
MPPAGGSVAHELISARGGRQLLCSVKSAVSTASWHVRHIRKLIYTLLGFTVLWIGYSSVSGAPNATQAWVAARESYGLWALALLVASMLPGPLNFVLPWLPIRAHLVLGRRALGVSCFILATLHMICYLGPTIRRNWHELFTPGRLWIAGLAAGVVLFSGIVILAFTSRNKAVRRLGPRRWKRLHKSVYWLLPIGLLHAILLGADFGVNKAPDVKAEVDAGCLVTMLLIAGAWLGFFVLRSRRVRWTPRVLQGNKT